MAQTKIPLNPGSGPLAVAVDRIAGDDFELVKITLGAIGTDDGPVSATNPLPIKIAAPTGTASRVGDSASSVTVLAANAARRGATFFNESTAILYLKFGATASTTSYAVQIPSLAYYELPFGYTGICDGIWASDAGGNVQVTEVT